jgi:competence ComEA-like helix-hairpin-helix protein
MSKQFIRDYFTFSGGERRGIIILLILITLTLATRLILPSLKKQTREEKSTFDREVGDWINTLPENKRKAGSATVVSKKTTNIPLFDFDPNVISSDDIQKLGVNPGVIKAWINYRKKGGKFNNKEDLKKIYGLDSNTYSRLEPYILSGHKKTQSTTAIRYTNKNILTIEINRATQEEFENLIGIGPVLAKRICKYRNLLGGFYSIGQLNEVFGITDSIVKLNENMLLIDKSEIERININKADFQTLVRHPYISDYEAKAILHYREIMGTIKSSNELVLNNLVSDSVFTRITEYLIIKEI